MRGWWICAATVTAACASDPSTTTGRPASPPAPARPASATDPDLLRSLAVLATRKLPSGPQIDDARARIDGGQLAIADYVDSLLAAPEFASDVLPVVTFRALLTMNNQIAGFVLDHTETSPPIYHLHEPCKPKAAVTVRPWWDLDHPVRICNDSYRPDKWTADRIRGRTDVACKSGMGQDRGCGCGPNLIRCFPSKDRYRQLQASTRDEIRRTAAYVASQGKPLDAMFVSNETWRDRDVELHRRMQVIEERRIKNPEPILRDAWTWPAEGKWAPREDVAPGQNAGVLTAAQIINFFPDRRQRMTTIYDVLYCDEPDSAGATPELVTQIAASSGGKANFQISQDHWKELAARPICTNCHARLDYGLQFFHGFENVEVRGYFSAVLQYRRKGPLYVRNIDDPRGEAALNPQGFAQLAITQPEHARCFARNFAEYVLAGRATADHIDRLAEAYRPGQTTAQEMMRGALLQLIEQWHQRDAAPPPGESPPGRAAGGDVAVSPAVRKQLDERCADCHDGSSAEVPDLSKPALPRATAIHVLDSVAFGVMPKDRALIAADRSALLEPLIASIWSGGDAAAARGFYLGRMLALPAYRPEVVFSLVHQRAGSPLGLPPANDWRMLESSTRPHLEQASPGLLTQVALEALEACRRNNTTRAEIDACIAGALRLDDIVIDRR